MTIYKDAIGGDHQTATFIVAASDSLYPGRADYICDGTADQVEIQTAIDALPATGDKVIKFLGNFIKNNVDPITVPSNCTLDFRGGSIAFANNVDADATIFENDGGWGGNTKICIMGGTLNLNASGNTGRQFGVVFHSVTDSMIDCQYSDYDGVPIQLYDCINVITNPSFDTPNTDFTNFFAEDIIKTTKDGANPMTAAGRTFGMVWKEGATYHMYTGTMGVYHYTSANGTVWTEDVINNPMISLGGGGDWDDTNIYCPLVWKEGATWYMLYGGYASDGICKVGLATANAPEGPWTKNVNNPVFEDSNTEWGPGSEPWGIIKVGSEYQLWYNNYGSGKARMTGRATSTDLLNWTSDMNNPVYTDQRFCPWIFKFGDSYYMLVVNQPPANDYAKFELYKDMNPTFYSNERTFMGVIQFTSRHSAAWDGGDMDTPAILTSNIDQSMGVSAITLKMYYSGATQGGNWAMGLATLDSDVLNSGEWLYDTYTSGNTPVSSVSLSEDTARIGRKSLKIDITATNDYMEFPVNSVKGKVAFYIKQKNLTSGTSIWVYLNPRDYGNTLGMVELYSYGKIQYYDDNNLKGLAKVIQADTWYLWILQWDSNIGEYSITIKDHNLNIFAYIPHLKMRAREPVHNIRLHRYLNPKSPIYIGGIYTGSGELLLPARPQIELFMDVLAVSATHIRSNEDLSAATPITFTIDAQPDVPRTLSWSFDSHAQITAYDMEVIGVDAKGNTVTETWDETAGWAGETSNAFATITSIKMTSRTGTGAADTMDIGITDVIGLSNMIYATSDVFKIKKNNANATVAGAQVNTAYNTYDMSVIGLGAADDFTIWYKSNLNIIS